LNVLLIAFLGLKYVVVSTTEGILNLSLCILVVLFYLLLTLVVFTKIKMIHRNKVQHIGDGSKLEKDKWAFLFEDIKMGVNEAAYIIVLNGIKDFLIPLVVVFSV
jgi:hypothetical protein